MRRRLVLAAPVAVFVLVACGRSGMPDGPTLPVAEFFPEPAPTFLVPLLGDGRDGDLLLTTGGTFDTCRRLHEGTGNKLVLADTNALAPGDRAVVWQVQASFAVLADPGPVTTLDSAGRWQLVGIEGVDARTGTVLVDPPLARVYGSDDRRRAQLCRMPQFDDLEIATGALRPVAWNGTSGGFVGFFVRGALTLGSGASIDASGTGFRGGTANVAPSNTRGVTAETTTASQGGGKGEGLDGSAFGLQGRGNLSNGAGGGNSENAGGGGGGGAVGRGGDGGYEFENTTNPAEPDTRGRPGSGFDPALAHLLPGGGGGAGHQNNGAPADGGAGGGVILVFTHALEGSGALRADGEDGASSIDDGAGGGGGGGSVTVRAEAGAFAGTISTRGGHGGYARAGLNFLHGPAGGGGGGRVVVLGLSSAAVAVDVSGGANGTSRTGQSDPGNPHGAQPGEAGSSVFVP